jgi:hypothetical protein
MWTWGSWRNRIWIFITCTLHQILLGWCNRPKRHVSYKTCFDYTRLNIALKLVTPPLLRGSDASTVCFKLIPPYCRGIRCGSVIKVWWEDTRLSTEFSYSGVRVLVADVEHGPNKHPKSSQGLWYCPTPEHPLTANAVHFICRGDYRCPHLGLRVCDVDTFIGSFWAYHWISLSGHDV